MKTATAALEVVGDRRAANAPDAVELAPSIVTLTDSQGPSAELIRALRNQFQSQHLQAGRRALAICEVSRHSGATFVATNLAVALSQIGVETLLVDGNLREPRIDQLIQRKSARGGLHACLESDDANVADFIEEDVLPGLSVLYAGAPAENAQELLARDRFEVVMNSCLRSYDATIVDTPPANLSADALRISNVLGYSLIVTRKNRSLVADVRSLISQLEVARAVVIGTVLDAS